MLKNFCLVIFLVSYWYLICTDFSPSTGLSGAMASISVRSGAPGSPTHVSGSSSNGGGAAGGGSSGSGPVCRNRRNGLQDVDLNTFISEEMALHLDSTGSASAGGGGARKRNSTQCSDVITDSPTHKRNRMIWSTACLCVYGGWGCGGAFKARRGGLVGLHGTYGQTDARTPGCAIEPELKTVTECLSSVCSGVEWILFLVSFPYTINTNCGSAVRTLVCACKVTGSSGRHHTLTGHRCPGKETMKKVSWNADGPQRGENALCCLTSKSHLILTHLCPSLTVTHPHPPP